MTYLSTTSHLRIFHSPVTCFYYGFLYVVLCCCLFDSCKTSADTRLERAKSDQTLYNNNLSHTSYERHHHELHQQHIRDRRHRRQRPLQTPQLYVRNDAQHHQQRDQHHQHEKITKQGLVKKEGASYHVTVIRGDCCKPQQIEGSIDGKLSPSVETDYQNDDSLLNNYNKNKNKRSIQNRKMNKKKQLIDDLFTELMASDSFDDRDIRKLVIKHNLTSDDEYTLKKKLNKRKKEKRTTEPLTTPQYDTSNFESIFLLDKLTQMDDQISQIKTFVQEKMFQLEQTLTSSASQISFTVEHQQEQHRYDIEKLLNELQQQHQEQLDMQDQQQSQLIKLREEHQEQLRRKPVCRNSIPDGGGKDYENEDDDEDNDDDDDDSLDEQIGARSSNDVVGDTLTNEVTNEIDSSYDMTLKDEPKGNESKLLEQIRKEFSVLHTRLEVARKKIVYTEKIVRNEIAEKEKISEELDGRIRQLHQMNAELHENINKNTALELTLAELTKERDILQKELFKEKNDHDYTIDHLTRALHEYHEINEKYENQTILVDLIRSRLDDCITNQLTLNCEFEDSRLCGFTQDKYSDNLDWVRTKGSDTSIKSYSRPKIDHTCQSINGYYMSVLVSTRMIGQVARMKTPRMFGYTEQCVEFYYWISGRYVGTLNVYAEVPDDGLLAPVWRVYGNQGDVWIKARLNIPAAIVRSGYQMVFEGIMDRGPQGDIAIDDFKVEEGHCDRRTTPTPNIDDLGTTSTRESFIETPIESQTESGTDAENREESVIETESGAGSSIETESGARSAIETEIGARSAIETEIGARSAIETESGARSAIKTEGGAVDSAIETESGAVDSAIETAPLSHDEMKTPYEDKVENEFARQSETATESETAAGIESGAGIALENEIVGTTH